MGYEVDFLALGDGEKSGDAIALCFGNLNGHRSEQTVVVIDGGFKESGDALVEHIKYYYRTEYVHFLYFLARLDRVLPLPFRSLCLFLLKLKCRTLLRRAFSESQKYGGEKSSEGDGNDHRFVTTSLFNSALAINTCSVKNALCAK
jgi:hypothetical protein